MSAHICSTSAPRSAASTGSNERRTVRRSPMITLRDFRHPQEVLHGAGDRRNHARRSPCSPRTSALFRDSVREFAEAQVRPLVREMDEQARMSAALIRAAVRARRHGHRGPRGATAARAAASSTPCSRSRSCRGSTRRSACWWTSRTRWSSTRCCAGAARTSSSASCHGSRATAVGAYALSEAGSGSDAFALTTRAREDGDRFRAERPQAVDHQRQRSRRLHRVRDAGSRRPATAASPRSWSSAAPPGSPSARRRTSSASAPAAPASCCSTTAACRARTCSASSARATRSRSKR